MTLDETPCPQCKRAGFLALTEVLEVNPPGRYSLAGTQMKVAATARPKVTCAHCKLSKIGWYHNGDAFFPH